MILNDSPIKVPADDRFGIEPFATSLARSIASIGSPEGVVVALNGPWGSGKSSAVNLILYHFNAQANDKPIKVIRFNPWWFSGQENLTLAFFQELCTAFEQKSLEKAKSVARWLGKRLSDSTPLLTAAVNYATGGLGGEAAAAGAKTFGDLLGAIKPSTRCMSP